MRLALVILALGLSACGYRVVGSADSLPKTIHTIAIPQVGNVTTQYKLSDQLGTYLTREFISRTRYRIVVAPNDADATLTCRVANFVSYPTILDPGAGRATGVQVIVSISVTLRDKAGAVLFTQPNFEVRERYEISIDPKNYFDENEPATQRLAQDVARTIVSAVLTKF